MFDLFGDRDTAPQCAGLKKRLFNAAHGFEEFWKAWPQSTRKVAKKQCLDKWARLECCDEASLIVQHVEWMKGQNDWLKNGGEYIPAPLVYLNQKRWDGWQPEPERPKKPDALEVIKAHVGAKPSDEVREKMKQLLGRRSA